MKEIIIEVAMAIVFTAILILCLTLIPYNPYLVMLVYAIVMVSVGFPLVEKLEKAIS